MADESENEVVDADADAAEVVEEAAASETVETAAGDAAEAAVSDAVDAVDAGDAAEAADAVADDAAEASGTADSADPADASDSTQPVKAQATLVEDGASQDAGWQPPLEAEPVSDSREGSVPNPTAEAVGETVKQLADIIANAAQKIGAGVATAATTGAASVKRAVTEPDGAVNQAIHGMGDQISSSVTDATRKPRFAQVGTDLFLTGAVTSHGGNLSETDGEHIWITRTNSMLGHLDRADIIRTTWEASEADADCSRELVVHRAIYHALAQKAADDGEEFSGAAIVHAHTTNTIFRSLIEDEIAPTESESSYTLAHPVKVFAPEESIASEEAAELLAGAVLAGESIAVLRGHGPFAVADDIFGAERLVFALEQAAKIANLHDATGK